MRLMKIHGLYQKRGWFYYQPPTVGGVRPGAVALGTKDESAAVDEAFRRHHEHALQASSVERMEALLTQYLLEQRSARVHTLISGDCTRRVLGPLARDWGNPRVADITRKKVEQWRAELQLRPGIAAQTGRLVMSEASINSYLRRLHAFLSWCVAERYLRANPMDGIRLGRVRKTRRERFCTVEDRERLLAHYPDCGRQGWENCQESNEAVAWILHLGFFAGLRFGEMLSMQASWWTRKGDGWLLTVQETPFWKPKDKECRTIEVHPRLAEFVKTHGLSKPFVVAPHKTVYPTPPRERYNPKAAFKSHVRSVGLGWVSYHTLRHSFATHLAAKGATIVEIAAMLGDSLRVTEQNYIGYAQSRSVLADI
jgi:integrase